jgi:hypothetical protein
MSTKDWVFAVVLAVLVAANAGTMNMLSLLGERIELLSKQIEQTTRK